MQTSENWDWYFGNEMTGTGHDDTGSLTAFFGSDHYDVGNTVVQYAPNATLHPSACETQTYGLSYNGFTWSSTATICPDSVDPMIGSSKPGFGSKWRGRVKNTYVGINPVDLVHNPPNASVGLWINVGIAWR